MSCTQRKDGEETMYQITLLAEAGLIVANAHKQGALVQRLTWEGHDFLDAVRSDTVWNKTKEKVTKSVGSASLEVVKAVAEAITRASLGLG